MLKPSYLTVNLRTKWANSILYLSNQKLFINLKSFIMKKTILTTAFALFAITAITANEEVTNSNEATVLVEKNLREINSFCKAIVKGDLEAVKKLISLGEDVNKKSLGKTPAIFAARYNRAKILRVLIANGADLSKKCDRGFSIKKYAELSNATDALRVIEEASQS